jgi:hypothetical protein
MKPLQITLWFCLLSALPLRAAVTDAFVRQTDLKTGQVYDIPYTTPGGPYTSPLPVSEDGAKFELFARGTAWDTNIYLLDTKLIYAYGPTARLSITTEDPYVFGDSAGGTYVKRTRSDRPFTITTTVSGLVSSSDASAAEKSVYYEVRAMNYDPVTYSSLNMPTSLLHAYNLGNGELTWGPVYHELASPTLMSGCGQQTYTCVQYAADNVPDTILAQPTVQIWPVATANIDKITSGQVFIDRIPTITFAMGHLYPDSRTYAQIYPGPAVLGKVGTLITGTERRYGSYYNPNQGVTPTNVPQDVQIAIDNISAYASADGIYTLEVITETPFFNRTGERLLKITFEVDRVISSRGALSTGEKPAQ